MKRSEQIVELMDDVKKIISQMAVVDVCEEEKPVEVGKTIMTSREVADMFQEYHSVTYRRIAQLIVELEPMEQTEFKMAQFKARHQEYPMWELTEKACKLYLTRMKRDRCSNSTTFKLDSKSARVPSLSSREVHTKRLGTS